MKRKNLKRIIGATILILTVLFWCYVGIWMNLIYPFIQLIILVLHGVGVNVFVEALKILVGFIVTLIITVLLYLLVFILIKDED